MARLGRYIYMRHGEALCRNYQLNEFEDRRQKSFCRSYSLGVVESLQKYAIYGKRF